jgi:hypothetical protein
MKLTHPGSGCGVKRTSYNHTDDPLVAEYNGNILPKKGGKSAIYTNQTNESGGNYSNSYLISLYPFLRGPPTEIVVKKGLARLISNGNPLRKEPGDE